MSKLNAVKRENYFTRVRKRWKRRDVIEIDEKHSKYIFTLYIRLGIQEVVSKLPEKRVSVPLCDEDYKGTRIDDVYCRFNHTQIQFHTFAPNVFSHIRQMVGLAQEDYLNIISPQSEDCHFLEFLSNSKSGQNFFFTNNRQLVIKTITKQEAEFFMKILSRYVKHFQAYPHSLLVKFLGLHSVKLKALQKPIHFIVMLSIFYPGERIHHRYDIKACEIGRFTNPVADESGVIVVLKEKNLKDGKIKLGSQRGWFLRQVKLDTDFLRTIGVLDYSMLVGIQSLHQDEKEEMMDLATVFRRAQKSISKGHSIRGKSPTSPFRKANKVASEPHHSSDAATYNLPGMVSDETNASKRDNFLSVPNGNAPPVVKTAEACDFSCIATENASSSLPPIEKSPVVASNGFVTKPCSQSVSSDLFCRKCQLVSSEEAIKQNRRLLPNYRNELHVIDGEERYYVGVIDFFTRYTLKKKLENAYKRLIYPPLSFSTVPPNVFATRFNKYWEDHTE